MVADKEPLVSIVIITYNSSKYVLETLRSAKLQTYRNIELIVSDDFSKDNTIKICSEWIANNQDRFVRTELVTVNKNTGIAANCNRGLNSCQGDWVKFIAGDDILLANCLTDLVSFVVQNKGCKILFGRNSFMKENIIKNVPANSNLSSFFKSTQPKQFKQVLKGVPLNAQGSFYEIDTLKKIGAFNVSFPFMEDAPLYFKLSQKGYLFYSLDKVVAIYRQHENNISGKSSGCYINTNFYFSSEKFLLREVIPILFQKLMILHILNNLNIILVTRLIILFGNKNNLFSKFLSLLILNNAFSQIKRSLLKNKLNA
jgi:glycosyltransferase involved in cell wall biosynthesis